MDISGSGNRYDQLYCGFRLKEKLCPLPRRALKPHCLVDHVLQWLALLESADVLQEHGQVPFGDARGIAGDMRRDDDIFHAPERMISRQRLDLEDIETGPCNFTGP